MPARKPREKQPEATEVTKRLSTRFVPRDPLLLEYATDREKELLTAYWDTGNADAAAARCGVGHRSTVHHAFDRVRARAARAGYAPEANHTQLVPPGYRLRGTSTLYAKGSAEPVMQWVKTTHGDEHREEMLREMIAGFCAELPRQLPSAQRAVVAESGAAVDLCAVYPVGDHHIGMYAWKEEAGADYDLDTAETLLNGAFAFLTAAIPATETAVVILLGDLFHYDSLESVTPASKNLLDSDGRYAKMVRTCIRVVRQSVAAVLVKHPKVHIIVQPGNHDPSSSVMLREAMAAIYENEPRITVDTSPSAYHYWKHGRCLIGVCHGHEPRKLEKLPLIMASDRPEEWGATSHRYWYTGHIHQDRILDIEGVRVESFRILPPSDAWAHTKGYRSGREMKAIVLHKEYGETLRIAFRPEMLEAPVRS